MRKLAIVAMTIFGTLVIAGKLPTAQAGLVRAFHKGESSSERKGTILVNLKHVTFVCHIGLGKVKKEHCKGMHWLKRELAKLQPQHPSLDSCTRELLNSEGGMNPHKWNGGYVGPWTPNDNHGGSGAYGGPQALPGSKMRSAGADWADNIWTQIKWMRGYVMKYGGMCAALSFQRANGYY